MLVAFPMTAWRAWLRNAATRPPTPYFRAMTVWAVRGGQRGLLSTSTRTHSPLYAGEGQSRRSRRLQQNVHVIPDLGERTMRCGGEQTFSPHAVFPAHGTFHGRTREHILNGSAMSGRPSAREWTSFGGGLTDISLEWFPGHYRLLVCTGFWCLNPSQRLDKDADPSAPLQNPNCPQKG